MIVQERFHELSALKASGNMTRFSTLLKVLCEYPQEEVATMAKRVRAAENESANKDSTE